MPNNATLADDLAGMGAVEFLADSGAFSAFTTGATVTVDGYAEWLRANRREITAAISLDVIGDHVGTRRNTERLAELVDGAVPVLPMFHVGSPWSELERICAEGWSYVCLGGAVHLSGKGNEPPMLRWAVKAHKIARAHGTKLHGLELTRPRAPRCCRGTPRTPRTGCPVPPLI